MFVNHEDSNETKILKRDQRVVSSVPSSTLKTEPAFVRASLLKGRLLHIGTALGTTLQSKIFRKIGLISGLLILFMLCINGGAEKAVDNILGLERVNLANGEFLHRSLLSASGHFIGLGLVKGGLSVISNFSIDVGLMGTGASMPVGKVLSSFTEGVEALWRFFGYSMASITAQIALLKFLKLLSIKVMVSIGTLLTVIGILFFGRIRKFGIALMLAGMILYVLTPYSIYCGRMLFEQSNMESSIALSEDIGVLGEKATDMDFLSLKNFTSEGMRETITDLTATLSQTFEVVISTSVKYFSNMLIMFVIVPLFFYGLIYITIKQTFAFSGLERHSDRFDDSLALLFYKARKEKRFKAVSPGNQAEEE